MTIKQLIILIAVLMATAALLGYLFIFKSKELPNNSTQLPVTDNITQNENLPPIPTRTSPPDTASPRPTNPEDGHSYDIATNIENWQKTNNPDSMRQALILTHGTSNEAFLNAWVNLLQTSPSDVTDVLADGTSENDMILLQSADLVFSWFIDMSGNFTSLSPLMQQEVKKSYEQIKIYTNARS